MIVYHGTGHYNLDSIRQRGLCKLSRNYVRKKCACTTTAFSVAQLFALRHSSSEDFLKGVLTGIVLEYELTGRTDHDYAHVEDRSALQKEDEIAVFNIRKLKLLAVWHNKQDQWVREPV